MATILVVDDSATKRGFLVDLLGCDGHQMLEACDGAEALARVRQWHPDLVITDLLMPNMDGYEFVRQLRADPVVGRTRVVFNSSTYDEQEIRPLAKRCGVAHILHKPAEPEAVLAAINEELGIAAAASPPCPPPTGGGGVEWEFDQEHLRVLTNKLSQKADELEIANLRMAALIELGKEFAAEHDPQRLIERCCAAAREIMGARYAALGIMADDGHTFRDFVSRGPSPMNGNLGRVSSPEDDLLSQVLTRVGPVRLEGLDADRGADNEASQHPAMRSFLGVPLRVAAHVLGILYVVDKSSGAGFSEEDERLLDTVATQLALAYENVMRQEELEQRVKQRTVELKRSNAELEQFAYVAAHDLQEPLRKVIGYSQLLSQMYKGRLDANADEIIGYAVDGALRMQKLIQDLLDYSRVARKPIEFEPVQSEAVMDQALANLRIAVLESGAVVTRDPLPEIMGHEGQLVQVFQNLVGNAIKFCSGRTPEIHVGAERKDNEWVFSVRDNGIGIDPKHAERIFVIFQRLHTRTEYPGTGIGLAICRKVVERHGGRIWVESQPGQGSVFFFTIPCAIEGNPLEEQSG